MSRRLSLRSLRSFTPSALAWACVTLLAAAGAQAAAPAPAPKAAVAAAVAGPLVPVTKVEGITEFRLPNGLQVLLAPDDAKPTTTVNLTYHVGSRQENYGETGMAHLLEHLMFKGTPTHPAVWAEFSKRGLRANGSTWLDRTNYFASFTANDDTLRWFLDWQADAMVNSFIARKDLDTEMTVVRNEMERSENDPSSILEQKVVSAMYEWHNYGKSTIGARTDVENVDIPRLQAFYRQYYQPDNATLIVAGKFDAKQTLAWIQQAFAKTPKPTRVLPKLYTLDPVQEGERSVVLRRQGGTPLLNAAYPVMPGAHPDSAAMTLLGSVMGDVPGGRLHQRLVTTGLAAAVEFDMAQLFDPGFIEFQAKLSPGQAWEPTRDKLLATLESVGTEPVTAEELERARGRWLKSWELRFANPESVGVALSESVALGDWRMFFLQRDRIKAVTLADINRVGAQRLLRDNRTLGIYLPDDHPQRPPAPQAVAVADQFKDYHPVAELPQAEAFDATPANIEARTHYSQIAPGLKLALLPKGTRGDLVNATLALHLGDEASLKGQSDAAEMMAALLDKGSATLSRQQIQDRLTALKAELAFSGGPTRLQARIVSPKDNLPAVIALMGELLRQPAFPAAALEELRQQSLASLESQRKEPQAILSTELSRRGNPYPRGDVRYSESFDEQAEDLRALTLAQVKAFHQRFVGAGNAEFAAVGAMDEVAVKAALEKALGGWQAQQAFQRVPDPLVPRKGERMVFETPDKQNASLYALLSLPVKDGDADEAALRVANFIFGQGGNSRLWKHIREAEGLSYSVGSGLALDPLNANSTFYGFAIFAPQNRAKVEAAFKQEFDRALAEGFSAAEVAQAQQGLLNARRLARAQDGALAAGLASNLYLGRTQAQSEALDKAIAGVTAAQVSEVWRRHVQAERLLLGVAGDFKGQ